jgi:hypothetical protein
MAMVVSGATLVSVLLESTFSRIRLLRASVEDGRNMKGSNATLLLGGEMYARRGSTYKSFVSGGPLRVLTYQNAGQRKKETSGLLYAPAKS